MGIFCYFAQNLSSTELISSHESLPSLIGYPGPSVSHLPGYNSLHHHYSSTHSLQVMMRIMMMMIIMMMIMISLQGQTNYSMPPHLNNYIIDRLVQEKSKIVTIYCCHSVTSPFSQDFHHLWLEATQDPTFRSTVSCKCLLQATLAV